MRIIDYSGDTVFLELNADSTFLYKSLSGTWAVADGKVLELTLPPHQEMYVMSFNIQKLNNTQLILKGPNAEPQTFTRIE